MKLQEILVKLRLPVPQSFLKTKTIQGRKITFISWYDYCQLLDERCGLGNWSWDCNVTQVGSNCIVEGRLTIYGEDRTITMTSTGTESVETDSYGDPSSNAEAMALRRCCAKFGLARELWTNIGGLDDEQVKTRMLEAKNKTELTNIKQQVGDWRTKKIYNKLSPEEKQLLHDICTQDEETIQKTKVKNILNQELEKTIKNKPKGFSTP